MKKKIAKRLILVMLMAMAAGAQEPASAPAEPPTLALEDLAGQKQSLADYRGKIVILNFWATWCVPCREEMPMLERLHREYGPRGVVVIGPSADDADTQKKIAPFVAKLKLTFPIWRGATTADMERFALGSALPATAVIDRDGSITGRLLGPLEEAALRARIEWMLGERAGEAPPAVVNTFEAHAHAEGEAEHHDDHAHPTGLDGASSVPS